VLRRPYTTQPAGYAEAITPHFWDPWHPARIDAVATLSFPHSVKGKSILGTTAQGNNVSIPSIPYLLGTQSYTFLVYATYRTISTIGTGLLLTGGTTSSAGGWHIHTGQVAYRVVGKATTLAYTATTGTTNLLAFTMDVTNGAQLYLNGVSVASSATKQQTATRTFGANLIGDGTTNARGDSNVYYAAWFPRTLSEAEIRRLSDNPWAIYKPQTARIYSFPSGGTSEGSGTVDGIGSLVGAGQATHGGSGEVSGVGSLVGTGQATHSGSGTIDGIGSLVGEGYAPIVGAAEGSGTVDGIGSLVGAGLATHSGSGTVDGVGSLIGEGEAPAVGAEGSGTVDGVGSLVGAGESLRSGSGTIDLIASHEAHEL
jgi:hypothetical protein